jgi:IrrE N-terminal-like domain
LPDEPKLFALVHELKHHYRDQELLHAGRIVCGDYNASELIEKGAEVFAAEFIYPEAEFRDDLRALGIGSWSAENVVTLKRNCKAKVSYTYLCKRLERLDLIQAGQFAGVRFQNLEDHLHGRHSTVGGGLGDFSEVPAVGFSSTDCCRRNVPHSGHRRSRRSLRRGGCSPMSAFVKGFG